MACRRWREWQAHDPCCRSYNREQRASKTRVRRPTLALLSCYSCLCASNPRHMATTMAASVAQTLGESYPPQDHASIYRVLKPDLSSSGSSARGRPNTSFRAHFIVTEPLWDLVNQPNKSPATLTLSEVLFDTEERDLLKQNKWLWQRDVWDSRDNTTRYDCPLVAERSCFDSHLRWHSSMWYLKQRTRCDLDGTLDGSLVDGGSVLTIAVFVRQDWYSLT